MVGRDPAEMYVANQLVLSILTVESDSYIYYNYMPYKTVSVFVVTSVWLK